MALGEKIPTTFGIQTILVRMAKRYGHIEQKAMRQAMEILETAQIATGPPRTFQSREHPHLGAHVPVHIQR